MGQAHELVKNRLAELETVKTKVTEIVAQKQCFPLKALAVNGRDVIAAGVTPGPEVRRTLDRLLDQVISGEIPDEQKALLNFICREWL